MIHKKHKKGIFTIVHSRFNQELLPDSFEMEYIDAFGEYKSYMVLPPLRRRGDPSFINKIREFTDLEYDTMISRTIKNNKIRTKDIY